MKDIIKWTICDPFRMLGAAALISVTTHGVASIIQAVKGTPENPGLTVTTKAK